MDCIPYFEMVFKWHLEYVLLLDLLLDICTKWFIVLKCSLLQYLFQRYTNVADLVKVETIFIENRLEYVNIFIPHKLYTECCYSIILV